MINRIAKFILSVLLLTLNLMFGGTTGKLTGTIKSALDNSPLVGANIIIENIPLHDPSIVDWKPPISYSNFDIIDYVCDYKNTCSENWPKLSYKYYRMTCENAHLQFKLGKVQLKY